MKYVITDDGLYDFKMNRGKYRNPNMRNKIMRVLSSGVGYGIDSLLNSIKADSSIKEEESMFGRALMDLEGDGFISSIDDDSHSPISSKKGVGEVWI
jgi:2-hydroxy-3-keto-5-methylthiopentenyl-1-phosphate phosphatase